MIPAGEPVDKTIQALIPILNADDVIIDGGNTHFDDTERRTKYVESKGLLYIGTASPAAKRGH